MTGLADQKVNDSRKTIRQLIASLEAPYEKLEEYVSYTNQLALTAQAKDQLIAEKKKLEEMSSVIRKNKIKDDQNTSHTVLPAQIEEIWKAIERLEADIQTKSAAVESQKQTMAGHLEAKITENKDAFAAQVARLQNEVLLKANTPESTALADLKLTKKNFDALENKASTYKSYEETLQFPPTPIPEINEFKKKYEVRHKLWSSRKSLEEERQHWYNDTFVDQDAIAVAESLRDYNKTYTWVKSQLPRDQKDEVLDAYYQQVSHVKAHQDIYTALGNKSM